LKYETSDEVNSCAAQVAQYIMSKLTEIGATIPSAMMSQAPTADQFSQTAEPSRAADEVVQQST
jgi:hypothetical protein